VSSSRAQPSAGWWSRPPLCEASHATPFQAMITCRPEWDTGSWVPDEAAHKATILISVYWPLGGERRAKVAPRASELLRITDELLAQQRTERRAKMDR
jgi:hypothetical protein